MANPSVSRGVQTALRDTTNLIPNVADFIDAIDPRDVPFLSMLGWGKTAPTEKGGAKGANSLKFPCTSTTHTWLNDEAIPNQFVLNGAYTAGDGQIDVGTTVIKYLHVDDTLMARSGSTSVYWNVTGVDTATGIATVELVGDSTDAAVATTATVYRIGNAQFEGATGKVGGESTIVSQTSNYTQNMEAYISVSEVERSVLYYGVNDNEKRHITGTLVNFFLQLEQQLIWNKRVGPASTTTKARFGGLSHYILDEAANMTQSDQVIDASGASLTEALFERVTRAIYLAGGSADVIMVPPIQKSQIDDWNLPYVRLEGFNEEKYGGIVSRYRNSFFDGEIVINRWLPASDIIFLTKKYIGFGPLNGNEDLSFKMRLLADRGNTNDWYLSGTYTMEVRNNLRAHGWIQNLATS